jgi:hypothetical protein
MKYVYAEVGSSSQTISDVELDLPTAVLMTTERPGHNYIADSKGQWLEVNSIESERLWRNEELKLVASQEGIWKYAYADEVRAYMQELADYTDTELATRPTRPKTPKGNEIIL